MPADVRLNQRAVIVRSNPNCHLIGGHQNTPHQQQCIGNQPNLYPNQQSHVSPRFPKRETQIVLGLGLFCVRAMRCCAQKISYPPLKRRLAPGLSMENPAHPSSCARAADAVASCRIGTQLRIHQLWSKATYPLMASASARQRAYRSDWSKLVVARRALPLGFKPSTIDDDHAAIQNLPLGKIDDMAATCNLEAANFDRLS
jgi:hypothetical protein